MKKKTSIYFLIPLVFVILFAGYYNASFMKTFNAKEKARVERIEQEKKDKDLKAQRDVDLAFENAKEVRAKKDAAKKAKDDAAALEKDAKSKRKEDRAMAEADADRLIRTIDDKHGALADLTKEFANYDAQKKSLAAEAEIILKTVAQAKENTANAQAEVAQYQKAAALRRQIEQMRIEAEKAAAAAKK